jgi:GTP diphosphokinase / guanosine-3',5'-bis(diphosphate) 3'-diphosphatase
VKEFILKELSLLLALLEKNFEEIDSGVVKRALEIALSSHIEEKRISGEPYFVHSLGVATIVAQMGLDIDAVCGAILHDVEPDEDILAIIEKDISPQCKYYIEKLSMVRKIRPAKPGDKEKEGYRRMVLAVSEDLRVVLIRIADRLHNMRTVDALDKQSRKRLAREVRLLYVPLANRMGLQNIKSEFENLCFAVLENQDFVSIRKSVRQIEKSSKTYVDSTVDILSEVIGKEEIFPKIYGRSKHLYSIYLKMTRSDKTIEQIHDILGFRILCDSKQHCYAILGIIHGFLKPVSGLFKDYIAVPKSNGYQSLHTTVIGPEGKRIEIQIRTKEMHDIAELGVAAHWLYKERYRKERIQTGRFRAISATADILKGSATEEFWSLSSFQSEIFVFTPTGELVVLPVDGTPLDFAFAVHTQVGSHCTGAKVDGQMVPLRSKLKTWDTIEVTTSANQHPNTDWLKFVTTTKAKNKIRHFLRKIERDESRKRGKNKTEKDLKKQKVSFSRIMKDGGFQKAAVELRYMNIDDLFMAVGEGKLPLDKLYKIVAPQIIEKKAIELDKPKKKKKLKKNKDSLPIEVDGLQNVMIKLAKCCLPISGDPIIGYVTRGRGITIHKKLCARANALEKYRLVSVKWLVDESLGVPVVLKVISDNKPGLMALMSEAFLKQNQNIQTITTGELKSSRVATMFRFYALKEKTDVLVRNLRKIRGVYSVSRTRSTKDS